MTRMRTTPAGLAALAKGDIGNFIVASTPGGIEAQEAAGQQDFVRNETLPAECDEKTREELEAAGVNFGESVKDDPIFVHATLPKKWKKRATDHTMWSELIDDKGKVRAHIFYKAAFYDRRAFIRL